MEVEHFDSIVKKERRKKKKEIEAMVSHKKLEIGDEREESSRK